ncbi:recombinase family protein (plasmid) [Roseibium porphyridii]|uniref:Recombinase family protein n=1 Tax=Roseibium porphyridii TaxID=2866279 RepID=A0ABY8FDB5_9HYPH|nr:recombinase family protein [Roseibium sp. KMA01]WFE92634.1 recombinase family protein [Roseibium sp. KMA01]
MKIGYARVSTNKQNLERQIAALRAEGCDKIYREKASGKNLASRPELDKAIDALGTDFVLIVAEWDRATRSMQDGLSIIKRVAERGAMIKVLDRTYIDLTTPMGKGILAFMSALAEDERQRIVKRAADGRDIARDKNVKFGPKRKLTEHQQELARNRLAEGGPENTAAAIGRDLGVSHQTILRLKG